jgi:hypothetical protein
MKETNATNTQTIEQEIDRSVGELKTLKVEMHELTDDIDNVLHQMERRSDKNWFSRNKRDIGMVSSGLAAGLVVAIGTWFYNRRKRKQMLEQMLFAIKAARTVMDVPDARSILSANGKDTEIKAADYLIESNPDLQRVIEEQMFKNVLGKKEHDQWVLALRALVALAQVTQSRFHVREANL